MTAQGQHQAYGPPPPQQPLMVQTPPKSGSAIGGMVLGIISLLVPFVGAVTGIVGLALSWTGFSEIKKNPELQGRGFAIAGLWTGGIATFCYGVFIIGTLLGMLSTPY